MAEAPRRADFLPKTSEDVLRKVVAKQLTPEDVASMMLVNREALRIFGNEKVWKQLATQMHIPIRANLPLAKRYRLSVVAFYSEVNRIALSILGPAVERNLDVFIQHTNIITHLNALPEAALKHYILKEAYRALANNQKAVIEVLMNAGGKIAAATRAALTEIHAAALAAFPAAPRDPDPFIQQAKIKEYLEQQADGPLTQYIKEEITRALAANQPDAIKILMNAGGRVAAQTEAEGIKKLIAGADLKNEAHIRCLLAAGIPINGKLAVTGDTALMHAVLRGHTEFAKMLIDRGASVNETDNQGQTAMFYAAKGGSADSIDMLAGKDVAVDGKDNNNETPLMIAAREGHTESARALINHGAYVNEGDDHRKTVLMKAAAGNNPLSVIPMLLDNDAHINDRDDQNRTALAIARSRPIYDPLREQTIQLLLARGAVE